ncbi:MAG: serine/threonine-protein phosphatase [Ruminococcus sp.]|nr:serine/threonine-protein phosphatase [Ruminococcus sp.]MBR2303742.1 serine/threonine-protein phosphatase [Ruminococcus sp.]
MYYYIYAMTDKGNYREINEDCVLVDHEVKSSGSRDACVSAPFITAVCDGVGGENAGELASKLCLAHLAALDYSSSVDLKKTVTNIHNKIKRQGVRTEGSANMQTTLCALAVDEQGRALCVNVGDSRMYRYVNGTVRQISTDQSYGRYLYDHGKIEKMSDLDPQQANAIISSVGSTVNEPSIDITPIMSGFGKEPDDMILITSDGFSDCVSPEEIEIGMELDIPIAKKLSALFHLALKNGSTDNLSVIGIKPYIDEEELKILTQRDTVAGLVKVENSTMEEIEPVKANVQIEKTSEIAREIKEIASSIPTGEIPEVMTPTHDPNEVTKEFTPIKEQPKEEPKNAEPVKEYIPEPKPAKKMLRTKADTAEELKKMLLSSLDDLNKI